MNDAAVWGEDLAADHFQKSSILDVWQSSFWVSSLIQFSYLKTMNRYFPADENVQEIEIRIKNNFKFAP